MDSRTEFMNCKLMGLNLSDSVVESLRVQPEDLRGAIVSPLQAVDFSKLLGLVIKA
ncbi:MAG TPA: hypothetical protein VEG39_07495 [Clostridia bacterium]|nr:hypothetical protein [Clostridia bacterium]